MQTCSRPAALPIGIVFAVVLVAPEFDARPALARMQYMDALSAKYPKVAEKVRARTCSVCHGKQKTQRSDFAKALEAALGRTKVVDRKVINKALDAAGKKVAGGQTYGELLEQGMLPPPFQPAPK